MTALFQGRIVWCLVPDQQGRNPKIRPVVILTPDPQKKTAEELVLGVCVTHEIGQSPKEDCVPVPWKLDGNVSTKLKVQSEAVCTWAVRFTKDEIRSVGGFLKPKDLEEVLSKLDEIKARSS